MKINKSIWIFGLILILSSASVFAFTLSDIYRNSYFIFFVNVLIIWSILFVAQLFIIRSQDTRVRIVVWIVTLALAVLIVWNFTPRGAAYLWEAGWIAQYLKLTLLVNTLILAVVIFYIAGFLNIAPQTPQGQIGLVLGALLLAGMIAYSLPAGTWIWNEDNVRKLWDYLRGPEKTVTAADGTTYKVGGILTIDKANIFESRLFIFITSTILFAWFFTAYLRMEQSPRLTYVMAFIIGANLARQGTTSGTIIGIGEAFAILIIGGQVVERFGGRWWGWLIGITLVEWIFCAVFGQSRALQVIGEVMQAILNSGFVSILLALYIISLGIRSPNWIVGTVVAAAGTLFAFANWLAGKLTLGLGDAIRRMLDIDICKLLAKHTIVGGASGATGPVKSFLGGMGINIPLTGTVLDNIVGFMVISGAGYACFKLYQLRNKFRGMSSGS